MKVRIPAKNMPKANKSCGLVVCLDPKTGLVKLAVDGNCPPGWARKVKSSIAKDGLLWVDRAEDL